MSILYVTSRWAGSGKTALCTALAHELALRGKRVVAMKPLSGADESTDEADNATYDSLLSQAAMTESFRLSGRGLTADVQERVTGLCSSVAEAHDLVLVEGTSELTESGSARLIEALDARVLAVEAYHPGLDASALSDLGRRYGDRLVGVVVNGLTRYQTTRANAELLAATDSEGPPLFGMVPEDRKLLGVSVARLVEHLDGRYVGSEELDGTLVEHFLVGGMGLDSGEVYFGTRDSKAVIVRGDRPDVQMSALTTPTLCLVLTDGIEPIEYVRNEAELEEVPIAVVASDTMTTMSALNDLSTRARFDHPAKLQRFAELVDEHLDTDALYRDLGLVA